MPVMQTAASPSSPPFVPAARKRACLAPLLLLLLWLVPAGAGARELVIATSSSIPPFVIPEDRGIVIDIMREALAQSGHQLAFIFAPNRRVTYELENGRVDGVFNLPEGGMQGVFFSSPVVEYQNVAITLSRNKLDLKQVADLKPLRIAAFQNAPVFLGEAFASLVRHHPAYLEVSNQRSQLSLLYTGRVDVIVMERRIFEYFRAHAGDDLDVSADVRIHPLFPAAPRFAAFRDIYIRDLFNQGLAALRDSGRYQAIIDSYLTPGQAPANKP